MTSLPSTVLDINPLELRLLPSSNFIDHQPVVALNEGFTAEIERLTISRYISSFSLVSETQLLMDDFIDLDAYSDSVSDEEEDFVPRTISGLNSNSGLHDRTQLLQPVSRSFQVYSNQGQAPCASYRCENGASFGLQSENVTTASASLDSAIEIGTLPVSSDSRKSWGKRNPCTDFRSSFVDCELYSHIPELISGSGNINGDLNSLVVSPLNTSPDERRSQPSFPSAENESSQNLPSVLQSQKGNCPFSQSFYTPIEVQIPLSIPSDFTSLDVSLMPVSDIASGGSMTCTLVNLLRGLNLLDQYTVEDLCDYLSARNRRCQTMPSVSQLFDGSHSSFIRSSTPTFQYIKPPPPPNTKSPDIFKRKSTSLPSRIHKSNAYTEPSSRGGSLIDYLLLSSCLGSNTPHEFFPADSDPRVAVDLPDTTSEPYFASKNVSNSKNICSLYQVSSGCSVCLSGAAPCYLVPPDWRRGRSDGLLCALSGCNEESPTYFKSKIDQYTMEHTSDANLFAEIEAEATCLNLKPKLSCLLTGRFLPGSEWTRCWPPLVRHYVETVSDEDALVCWVSAWLSVGAVPFFAQLDMSSSQRGTNSNLQQWTSSMYYTDFSLPSPEASESKEQAPSELFWRHRLIFGISKPHNLHLSNPLEVVSARSIISELAMQTQLSLVKNHLVRLWQSESRPSNLRSIDSSSGKPFLSNSCASPPMLDTTMLPNQDLSILLHQKDKRWSRLNILGQLISTLRDCESGTTQPERMDNSLSTQLNLVPSESALSSNLLQPILTPVHADNLQYLQFTSTSSTVGRKFLHERLSSDPNIIIPCVQCPGFSIFFLKENKELVPDLLFS